MILFIMINLVFRWSLQISIQCLFAIVFQIRLNGLFVPWQKWSWLRIFPSRIILSNLINKRILFTGTLGYEIYLKRKISMEVVTSALGGTRKEEEAMKQGEQIGVREMRST
jgi:hypothetical protein